MLKLLHVHERASFHGGVEQILHDTANALTSRGWQQALLHNDPQPDDVFSAPFGENSTDRGILERFEPDAVLLHKVPDRGLAGSVSARFPTVAMVHDHDLVCLRRHKYFPVSGRICDKPAGHHCYTRLCFINRNPVAGGLPVVFKSAGQRKRDIESQRHVRRFVVGSRWMQNELVMNGVPFERTRVIHPIPLALAGTRPLPRQGTNEILYVGQVIRGKGVDLLIRALGRLTHPWHATIVGTGNHLDHCRNLAGKLGIDDRVDFTGWVAHGDLENHYARAAFTVVPSRWPEPFGMVGIEAMARGRAVVGFSAGGIPDWLRDGVNGLLVPPGDVERLAGAMTSLLADPELARRLGEGAARTVTEGFTHGAYVDDMAALLEAVT